MRSRTLVGVVTILCAALLAVPAAAEGQLLKKLKDAAERAVEDEAASQVDRLVRTAIRCAIDDPVCPEQARAAGEEVIFVDDQGEVIVDDDGAPITDRDQAVATAPPPTAPGEGAWANYDFVPGDEILFYDDFSNDNVGDFPRRLAFVHGNWEIVEWEGRRLLRNTGPRHSAFTVPLPRALPERFTIELDAYFETTQPDLGIGTAEPPRGDRIAWLQSNWFRVDDRQTGVAAARSGGARMPEALNAVPSLTEKITPIRIMVDGSYAKVYAGERRVANVPNAVLERSDVLWFENLYNADGERPMYLGAIRVAAGGADLYSRLEAEGRVATQGILFATNSDRIRPESTPTLDEIGTMLTEHPELRLGIEGHTDSDGEEAYNQDLSERRAASVKAFLVERYGIDESRLETAGFGPSRPAAGNDTPEGKQQNRRVELVRL